MNKEALLSNENTRPSWQMCYVLIHLDMMHMHIIIHTLVMQAHPQTVFVLGNTKWDWSDSGQTIAGTCILWDCSVYCRACIICSSCLLNGNYCGNQKYTHKFQNASSGNVLLLLRTAALRSGRELKLGQWEPFPRDCQTGAVQSMRVTVELSVGMFLAMWK